MNPVATVQGSGSDPDFGVTVFGQNFMAPLTTWLGDLGQNIFITVSTVTTTTITGMLSPNIPVGVYALTVENPDGQQGSLPRAFVVYPRPHPNTTFDSSVAYVATFGPAAPPTKGDDDHVQLIFFEVPEAPDDRLYLRIFDADTGNTHDEPGPDGLFGNTVMTYTVRGGDYAYSDPDARSDHPGVTGINSGNPIVQRTVGVDGVLDNAWLTLPISRTQGEPVDGSRVFKLAVQGASGDDGNWYQVAISADPNTNVAVNGARVFAYSWCVVLPSPGDAVAVYPYVPVGTNTVTQFNYDFDASSGSAITLTTPVLNRPVSSGGLSLDASIASEAFSTFGGERATTWTARYVVGQFPFSNNSFSLWFLGDGTALAIFTTPVLVAPPP